MPTKTKKCDCDLVDCGCPTSETTEKWEEEFDEKIPVRTMNKDNPQYVRGWNACRYLSKSFIWKAIQDIEDEYNKFDNKFYYDN